MLLMGFWRRSALGWRYVSILKGFIANLWCRPVKGVKHGNLVSSKSFPSFPESASKKVGANSLVRALGFFAIYPETTKKRSQL